MESHDPIRSLVVNAYLTKLCLKWAVSVRLFNCSPSSRSCQTASDRSPPPQTRKPLITPVSMRARVCRIATEDLLLRMVGVWSGVQVGEYVCFNDYTVKKKWLKLFLCLRSVTLLESVKTWLSSSVCPALCSLMFSKLLPHLLAGQYLGISPPTYKFHRLTCKLEILKMSLYCRNICPAVPVDDVCCGRGFIPAQSR